jgi:hypothetical protein
MWRAVLVLFAATSAVAARPLSVNDLVGNWMVLRACGEGDRRFSRNGEYFGSCFDTVESGRWLLPNSDKIVIIYGPKKSQSNTVQILKFEPLSDRMFLTVHWPDGRTEKWMK